MATRGRDPTIVNRKTADYMTSQSRSAVAAKTTTTTGADKKCKNIFEQDQHLLDVVPTKPSVRVSSAPSLLVLAKSDD